MTKKERIEEILLDMGRVSNVDTLVGKYGIRTNRLGAYVHILRQKYLIDTEVINYPDGEYKDCIYILKGKL